jgi:hypothetical protein
MPPSHGGSRRFESCSAHQNQRLTARFCGALVAIGSKRTTPFAGSLLSAAARYSAKWMLGVRGKRATTFRFKQNRIATQPNCQCSPLEYGIPLARDQPRNSSDAGWYSGDRECSTPNRDSRSRIKSKKPHNLKRKPKGTKWVRGQFFCRIEGNGRSSLTHAPFPSGNNHFGTSRVPV